MRKDIYGESSKKQPTEDKVRFVGVRKQSKHPVHQMRQLLISGEREKDQGLESLITVQQKERDETLAVNTIRISSQRSTDQVQDLRGHLLRKNSYCVVEFF